MKKNKSNKDFYKGLYDASTIGMSFVFSIIIGGLIGYFLDKQFPSTHPWLLLIFIFFGIAAAFRNLYIGTKKINKESIDKNDSNKKT
ncbi:AtpZ/AtpI family protein [Desulfurella sp.]|uniref:AtpZ/AtpI family protein n=1 Tax=Desulfurella sp. TaxID=1962857 RepID=UPI003D1479E6